MVKYKEKASTNRQFWWLYYRKKEQYEEKNKKWKEQGKFLLNGYPIDKIIPITDDGKIENKRDKNEPKELGGMPIIRTYDRLLTIDEMNNYLSKGYFVKRDPYKNKTYILKVI